MKYILFIDGSYLAVKDYLFPGSRKYAFHWEDAEGKRIIRWDNAPHWKSVATYPHHRHENSDVYASVEVSVEDIAFLRHSWKNKIRAAIFTAIAEKYFHESERRAIY